MKIDKARDQDEWTLTHDGAPVAIVRPWLGCYYVYLLPVSHTPPIGPFKSMLDAIKAMQPEKPKRKRMVYFRGTLTRRSLDEPE